MVVIPDTTRKAMIEAGKLASRSFIGKQNLDPDEVVSVTVGAAIEELERRLNRHALAPQPKPMPAGGNLFETGPTALGGPQKVLKAEAVARGYSGDPCTQCGNFRMRRTSTCLTCQDCGYNKGCD